MNAIVLDRLTVLAPVRVIDVVISLYASVVIVGESYHLTN